MRWEAMGAQAATKRTREVGRGPAPRGRAWVLAVVAEKPAVARDIARALGASQRGEGGFRGNGYGVTWARASSPRSTSGRRWWRREQLPHLQLDGPAAKPQRGEPPQAA